MAKNPGFTMVAIIALALGIGANATVFGIVNGVLFKRLPFASDRTHFIAARNLKRGRAGAGFSWPEFQDWRAQAKRFRVLAAYDYNGVNYSDPSGVPARYTIPSVTANLLSMIGQPPVIGRSFTPEDENPGSTPVIVLGYGIWQNRYGLNPAILGQTVRVNEVPRTIIGVMGKGIMFPNESDAWIPLIPDANMRQRSERPLELVGELAPHISQRAANAEAESIARNLERAYPDTNTGMTAEVLTERQYTIGDDITAVLTALMGAVLFVLLIACANVANLLLGRAVGRTREISIRIAIGAGRWRVIRQLLVESVVLSMAGGLLGWLIAIWGLRVFDAAVRAQIPQWINFSLDYRGFAYLAAISIGTGLLFGLAPASRLSRLDVNTSLKEGGRGSSSSRGKYLSGVLVVAEMALAVVLLAGAGVMIRSFLRVYTTQTGMNPKNVLVMRLLLPPAKYSTAEEQIAFHQRLKVRLDALPGVEASTIALTMPTGGSIKFPYEVEHSAPVDDRSRPEVSVQVIGLDYFRTMDVQLRRGRVFTDNDGVSGPPAVIVNQRFAEKFWPGEDPVGKRLRIFKEKKPQPWLTVVGVAPNILQDDIAVAEFAPLIYLPYRQEPQKNMALMARTRVPPATLATAFRREVQAIDQDMALFNLRTMEQRLEENYWDQRIFGLLFGIFAVIALTLASVGLYAVIAHSVSQRTEEIGVRIALGASATHILGMVFAQGMRQLAIGLAVGIVAALGLTRALKSTLVHTSATDPATFAIVPLILALAAICGCLIPARRAMRVDPVVALRHE